MQVPRKAMLSVGRASDAGRLDTLHFSASITCKPRSRRQATKHQDEGKGARHRDEGKGARSAESTESFLSQQRVS